MIETIIASILQQYNQCIPAIQCFLDILVKIIELVTSVIGLASIISVKLPHPRMDEAKSNLTNIESFILKLSKIVNKIACNKHLYK